jgi:pimeloyl-ACP methyl ester carboxylesterase
MSEWPERYVQAHDLNIHYYRTGGTDKPQVILLHGLTDSGLCWTPVARDLERYFDVLMPDARGHGRTGGPLASFSYKQLADDVAALIGALGLNRPLLWGHSMGAQTAATVAALYPALVRAIVLEDPPFTDAQPPQPADGKTEPGVIQAFRSILSLKNLPPEERLLAARTFNPRWDEVELGPWAESKVEFDPEVLQHWESASAWRDLLPRINCPLLLVIGDPALHAIVTPQTAQEAASLWQQGEILQVQGAGHCIHRDCYADTVPRVLDFLQKS